MSKPLFEQVKFCPYCRRYTLLGPNGSMDAQTVCNASTYCWPCQKLTFDHNKHKNCAAPGFNAELSRRVGAAMHQAAIDELLQTIEALLVSDRLQMQMCGDKNCTIADIDAKFMRAISGK